MKKAGAILILMGAMVGMAGCAVGPCEGYGCPAFAGATQAPQPATKAAASARASGETGRASSRAVLARAAQSGQ
jgi:hypothetical protein